MREPGVRVGINIGTYPRLSRIPGYPVFYAPGSRWNYFFHDETYWVLESDNWYASRGYNGPWSAIDPFNVPSYVLRVPVRYYTRPPAYFRGWRRDAPPRWDDHWGRDWSARRGDWKRDEQRAPGSPRDAGPGRLPQQRGDGTRPSAEPQAERRGRQLPQPQHDPSVTQPQERSPPRQPESREGDSQREDGPRGRGRGR